MKKIILFASLILSLTFISCRKGPDTPAPQPDPYAGVECATLDPTDVGPISAMLHGHFNPGKVGHIRYYYFLVSNKESICHIDSLMQRYPVEAYVVEPAEGETEVILPASHKLQTLAHSLLSDTTYFVRALIYGIDTVAQKDTFLQAANIKSFSTKALRLTTVTEDATDVGSFKAVLRGQVITNAEKNAPIDVRFYYSPDGSTLEDLKTGSWTDSKTTYGDDRSFCDTLKNLKYATTYHYVACANVRDKVYFGEIKSFTTPDFNPVVTTLPAVPGPVKATLNASVSPDFKGTNANLWFFVGPEGSTIESLKADGTQVWGNSGSDYASFSATSTILKMSTTYCYAAFVKIEGKEAHGDIVTFTTTSRTVPSDAVEMGLSVFWAPKNIGADSPEGYGGFYAWGEVETKNDYSYETYKWSNGATSGANGYTKYNSSETWGPVVDNKHFLEPEDDIATVTLGSPWRMPTRAEMEELSNYCNWEWKEVNGHPGYEITSRLTGNSIFLPAVSSRSHTNTEIITEPVIYFSNQKDDGFACYGFRLDKNSRSTTTLFREYGTNIRAVRE